MITGLICGGMKGFYDVQGVQVQPESLDTMLTFGPMALDGMLLGGYSTMKTYRENGCLMLIPGTYLTIGALSGAAGALVGGISTLLGYGIGCALGGVLK